MIQWFKSRRKLSAALAREKQRNRLLTDEVACLKRQRDAALDTIDRLRTSAQAETAANMALTESMRQR